MTTTKTTHLTQQQMDDIAFYLPTERREEIHGRWLQSGVPEGAESIAYFCAEYAREYGATELEECAELAGIALDVAAS